MNTEKTGAVSCLCEACRGHIANNELRRVSGREVRSMFSKHRLTIAAVADRFDVTKKFVRDSRIKGGPWDLPLMVGIMVRERQC